MLTWSKIHGIISTIDYSAQNKPVTQMLFSTLCITYITQNIHRLEKTICIQKRKKKMERKGEKENYEIVA